MEPLAQFNALRGGIYSFTTTTREIAFRKCPAGVPNPQNCDRFAPRGQILVEVVDDIATACDGNQAVAACVGQSLGVGPNEIGSAFISMSPRALTLGGHELMHALIGGCHPASGSRLNTSIGAGQGMTWTALDMAALQDASARGLLRGGVSQRDYRESGLIF